MSRPQKLHKPIKANFNIILGAIAIGSGKGKQAAVKLAKAKPAQAVKPSTPPKS